MAAGSVDTVSAVVLVDVSDSVSDGRSRWRARRSRSSNAPPPIGGAAPPGGSLRVDGRRGCPGSHATFQRDSATDAATRLVRFEAAASGANTDIALAIGLGAGLIDATALPHLLLVSDGRATRGDLAAAADRLGARGVALFALPLPPPEAGDVAVVALGAPEDVRPRVPFPLEIHLLSDPP